jgi:hypothetical protein
MPLLLLSIVSRKSGSETERCLCDTRCKGAMDWKLECSATYCNALRNIPRGLKEVSSRYGTKPFLMFPTEAHRSISTFDCGALQSNETLSVSHTYTHTHTHTQVFTCLRCQLFTTLQKHQLDFSAQF